MDLRQENGPELVTKILLEIGPNIISYPEIYEKCVLYMYFTLHKKDTIFTRSFDAPEFHSKGVTKKYGFMYTEYTIMDRSLFMRDLFLDIQLYAYHKGIN